MECQVHTVAYSGLGLKEVDLGGKSISIAEEVVLF